jgi:hypothetical protein
MAIGHLPLDTRQHTAVASYSRAPAAARRFGLTFHDVPYLTIAYDGAMRGIASLLVISLGCRHGRVVVAPRDVASHVVELTTNGKVELPANKQRFSRNWSMSTTTIRKDQRVKLLLSNVEIDGKNFSGVLTPTFGELLAECPQTPFEIDDATRKAHPRCKLIGADSITVGRTTHPGPYFWGTLAATVTLGTVACAAYCGSPFAELSTGAVIVGGALSLVAVVGIVVLAGYD